MYRQIQDRFGFEIPRVYREMEERGLLNSDSPAYLHLSDVIWMTPAQIAKFQPVDFQIPGLVPFARSIRYDLWCWHTRWAGSTPTPVVFCPSDEEVGQCFAPDFVAGVYRMLLEEFSGTWLDEPGYYGDAAPSKLASYAGEVAEFLPSRWASTLKMLSAQPFRELSGGSHGFLPRAEATDIARRDLAFPEFDHEFRHCL